MDAAPTNPECVHRQDPHNLIKTQTDAICPYCRIDTLEARLKRAESLIADAASAWYAKWQTDLTAVQSALFAYTRETQFRAEVMKRFTDAGKP